MSAEIPQEEIEESWFLDLKSYPPIRVAIEKHNLLVTLRVQRGNNEPATLLPQDQPLFFNQETSRPFIPGQTIRRSDLPDYFQNVTNEDHFFDANHPNVLILQDILHVEPTSATKHIEFSKTFHSAVSKPPAKTGTDDLIEGYRGFLDCTKEDYDDLGDLEITGFGGDPHVEGSIIYCSSAQSWDHAGNAALLAQCNGMSTVGKRILAVFQPIQGWPEKGVNEGVSVTINPHPAQELRFVGYYVVRNFNYGGNGLDPNERFADYPGLIMSNRDESAFLHEMPFQIYLKKAFSFETLSQMASGTPPHSCSLQVQSNGSALYFRKIRIPQRDLLRIQEEKAPGLYKELLASRNKDPQPDNLLADYPSFASGNTVVGDLYQREVLEEYLDTLATEAFVQMLLSTQTKPEDIQPTNENDEDSSDDEDGEE